MIAGNREHDADDDLAGLVDGLEQLARHLDAQRYPGRAWPVSAPRRPRPFAWQVVAPLAAVAVMAVIGAILVYHGRGPQSPMVRVPGRGETVRQSPKPLESLASNEKMNSRIAVPSVVVVEDAESYSFIDMTTGTPVVSFATKDSYSPRCVVPVLPEPASQAAEAEKFDEYQQPPVEEGRAGGTESGP
jgi:hypothetical protein